MSDGKTIGIWIGKDSSLVDNFDEVFKSIAGEDNYSRSDEIKRAMFFHQAIERVLAEEEIEFPSDVEQRSWITQTLRDEIRSFNTDE